MTDQLRARLETNQQIIDAATDGPWELDIDGDIQGRRKGMSPDPEMDPIVGVLERSKDTSFAITARTEWAKANDALRAVLKVSEKLEVLADDSECHRGSNGPAYEHAAQMIREAMSYVE